MYKNIIKIVLIIYITSISLLTTAQHHLYFYIPTCPTVNIDSEIKNCFTISPIPAKNTLQINFNKDISNSDASTIKIFNSNGQMVYINTSKINSINKSLNIDISYLKQGLYYLQYSNNKTKKSKKFIITR